MWIRLQDGDVILTYSHSTLVAAVLLKAHQVGRSFYLLSHTPTGTSRAPLWVFCGTVGLPRS